jgi:hypothetical protein
MRSTAAKGNYAPVYAPLLVIILLVLDILEALICGPDKADKGPVRTQTRSLVIPSKLTHRAMHIYQSNLLSARKLPVDRAGMIGGKTRTHVINLQSIPLSMLPAGTTLIKKNVHAPCSG